MDTNEIVIGILVLALLVLAIQTCNTLDDVETTYTIVTVDLQLEDEVINCDSSRTFNAVVTVRGTASAVRSKDYTLELYQDEIIDDLLVRYQSTIDDTDGNGVSDDLEAQADPLDFSAGDVGIDPIQTGAAISWVVRRTFRLQCDDDCEIGGASGNSGDQSAQIYAFFKVGLDGSNTEESVRRLVTCVRSDQDS